MFIAIVRHTPVWVWGLLAALIALGLSQARDREMTLRRVTVVPLVMLGLSLSGVFTAFGPLAVALGGWVTGLAAALALGRRFVAVRGAAWSPRAATLHVPGSYLPLVLIVGLFAVKYGVGVSLAMQPGLAAELGFAGPISLVYGGFGGLFLVRGLALRQLAARPTGMAAA